MVTTFSHVLYLSSSCVVLCVIFQYWHALHSWPSDKTSIAIASLGDTLFTTDLCGLLWSEWYYSYHWPLLSGCSVELKTCSSFITKTIILYQTATSESYIWLTFVFQLFIVCVENLTCLQLLKLCVSQCYSRLLLQILIVVANTDCCVGGNIMNNIFVMTLRVKEWIDHIHLNSDIPLVVLYIFEYFQSTDATTYLWTSTKFIDSHIQTLCCATERI